MALFTTREKRAALLSVGGTFLALAGAVWVWTNAAWVYVIVAVLAGLLIWFRAAARRR